MTKCPICNGKIEYKSEMTTYTYKKHSIEIAQSGEYCMECKEAFLSQKDLKSTKLQIANFKREVDHFLTTDELKRIRKKLQITQQDASQIFGGGIRAFHKYETAEVTQSKPLDILFRLIDSNKISFDDIKRVAI
ncbi:type II toxin-antitoxin system MqsA family antitoxin [Sulfurimonas sp.]|uniref:type II toxin-antitoxin system MqsA family antitoxin n=1 Tax=Sulfurimonas sp. TaxID=2022749 RepID=UPI0025FFEE23|nr:type II toxin-antitoxin system MqsA family antitoxin [Sulfurimonas sp.]